MTKETKSSGAPERPDFIFRLQQAKRGWRGELAAARAGRHGRTALRVWVDVVLEETARALMEPLVAAYIQQRFRKEKRVETQVIGQEPVARVYEEAARRTNKRAATEGES